MQREISDSEVVIFKMVFLFLFCVWGGWWSIVSVTFSFSDRWQLRFPVISFRLVFFFFLHLILRFELSFWWCLMIMLFFCKIFIMGWYMKSSPPFIHIDFEMFIFWDFFMFIEWISSFWIFFHCWMIAVLVYFLVVIFIRLECRKLETRFLMYHWMHQRFNFVFSKMRHAFGLTLCMIGTVCVYFSKNATKIVLIE